MIIVLDYNLKQGLQQ